MPCHQDRGVLQRMSLRRGDVADAAVAVLEVVPAHEVASPEAGVFKGGEAARRKFGAVLRGLEERFDKGVVVGDARARVRRFDAQPVQHGEHRGGLEGTAVVAVEHGFVGHRVDAFGQRGALEQAHRVVGMVGLMDLPPDDLAAVEVLDQVEVEPAPLHLRGQIGHVPTPDMARRGGHMRGRRARTLRGTGAAPVTGLPVGAQHALEARFAGDVDAFVGERRHDARWRLIGETRLISHRQDAGALLVGERMRGRRALGQGPAVADVQAVLGLPALQGAHGDAGDLARRTQARTGCVGGVDVADHRLAIFQADHASSSLSFGKIASSFFDSTRSAAASARAFSLRRRSRSSSLMRRRSAFFSRWLIRAASSGSASACVAAARHCSSSCGYTPFSRHQALLLTSSIAAVTNTASNRAGAVHRSRAGLDSASARHRSSVAVEILSSRETVSTDALSGGNNRAIALSLNACPYLATSFFRYRPQVSDSI
ncbi:hypothetical protein SDC9_119088 [bioreactor metagenome]|uniref:Uncharacterized protein n=1 Tax=bioreactor metagenome TaxID=1076179 RepID=A0A645C3J5_9ZZZZ